MSYIAKILLLSLVLISTVAYASQPPVALFNYNPHASQAPVVITFDASQSYDPDGTIVQYDWDFGDGSAQTTTNPIITHLYTTGFAVYPVATLTVTDNDNLNDTFSLVIEVRPSQAPTCSGDIRLGFIPQTARKGQVVQGIIDGLSNCDGRTISINGQVPSWNVFSASCTVSGSGCRFFFKAPIRSAGNYVYRARIDKNADGDFSDTGEATFALLKVLGWGWGTFSEETSIRQ